MCSSLILLFCLPLYFALFHTCMFWFESNHSYTQLHTGLSVFDLHTPTHTNTLRRSSLSLSLTLRTRNFCYLCLAFFSCVAALHPTINQSINRIPLKIIPISQQSSINYMSLSLSLTTTPVSALSLFLHPACSLYLKLLTKQNKNTFLFVNFPKTKKLKNKLFSSSIWLCALFWCCCSRCVCCFFRKRLLEKPKTKTCTIIRSCFVNIFLNVLPELRLRFAHSTSLTFVPFVVPQTFKQTKKKKKNLETKC